MFTQIIKKLLQILYIGAVVSYFSLFLLIGFALMDYLVFKKLQDGYGYPNLTNKEMEIVKEVRNQEYQKGNFYLFNWIPYKVEVNENKYKVLFYPGAADNFSWKFFFFVLTNGYCCGQKEFLIEK